MGEVTELKKREIQQLSPTRWQLAEHGRNVWLVTAENSKNPLDFLEPAFYALVAKDLRPYDHVEVRVDDGSYWAEMLVTACDRTWAKVELLRERQLSPVSVKEATAEYEVQFKGPHRKWCVVRLSDGSAVHEGESQKIKTIEWMETYLRTIGRPVSSAPA